MTMQTLTPQTLPPALRAPRDFGPDVAQMLEADASGFDMVVRWMGVAAAALAVTWLEGGTIYLVWAALYICTNTVYILVMLHAPAVIRLRPYLVILFLNALTSWLFVAMPLYLLSLGSSALEFAGICGIIGLCLHNLVRHRALHHVVICDIIVMSLCAVIAVWVFAQRAGTASEKAVILTSVIALASYFAVCFLNSMRMRSRLARAEELRGEAQKMEAVGRLTGGVAHDFNNILTVILGNLDLYRELDRQDERDAVVGEAHAAAGRAASLTAQLLSFSRRATLMPETIAMGQFLNGLGGMFHRILPATITLEIVPSQRGLVCHADPNQLSTALLNLVINARDAMPYGGSITVSAAHRSLPGTKSPLRTDGKMLVGEYCEITVRDTGPGIPPDLLTEVMTPFFTTKPLGKGSGLGLSMVLGFAEQTGGALTLENTGTGLAASLTLPAKHPQ